MVMKKRLKTLLELYKHQKDGVFMFYCDFFNSFQKMVERNPLPISKYVN